MNTRKRKSGTLHSLVIAGLTGTVVFSIAGCKGKSATAQVVNGSAGAVNGGDPALANLAETYTGGSAGGYNANGQVQRQARVLGARETYPPQESGESYYSGGQQTPAPIVRQPATGYPAQEQGYNDQGYNNQNAAPYQGYDDAASAGEQAIADADQPPPPLPEYDQPPAPEPDDLWTPGYWNYSNVGYYWVPGVWCAPPFYGALWTPPWWGYNGGRYRLHRGYWGHHVGYYGGINYGFGYVGTGYFGGYWRDRDFIYNRAVTNVRPDFRNVYSRPVVYNGVHYGPHPTDRVSYNGGRGGLNVQPRQYELAAEREAHYAPVAAQREVRVAAAANRGQAFGVNGGRPAEAFSGRPVGDVRAIAPAPRDQPVPREVWPGAPARLGEVNRPGTAETQSGLAGTQPGVAIGRGAEAQGGFRRPGLATDNRPPFSGGRPVGPAGSPEMNSHRVIGPTQPEFNGNRGYVSQAQPGLSNTRPVASQGRPDFNSSRGGAVPPQPGFGANRDSTAVTRPEGNGSRGNAVAPQPGFNGNSGVISARRPNFEGNRDGAIVPPQPGPNENGGYRGNTTVTPPGPYGNRGRVPYGRPEFNGNAGRGSVPSAQPGLNALPGLNERGNQPGMRPEPSTNRGEIPGRQPSFYENRGVVPPVDRQPPPAFRPMTPVQPAAPAFRPAAPAFRPAAPAATAPRPMEAPRAAPAAAPAPHVGGGGNERGGHH